MIAEQNSELPNKLKTYIVTDVMGASEGYKDGSVDSGGGSECLVCEWEIARRRERDCEKSEKDLTKKNRNQEGKI